MDLGLSARATEAAYVAQQLGLALPTAMFQRVVRQIVGEGPAPSAEAIAILRRRFLELLQRDVENTREGLYPRELLFAMPVATYAREAPRLLFEIPRVAMRRRREGWRELPGEVDAAAYPAYFRRTFHWQTDGYLSRRSAQLYDVGVELLFGGTADVMRRQVIPPITQWLRDHVDGDARGVRLLDVACGTGRTLAQIHEAHPKMQLWGVDLSPFYAQEARARLAHAENVSIAQENAEHLPFRDEWFDVTTSTYLFHELPRNARRQVLREMARVTKPGGLVVVEDSAQLAESEPVRFFLERFPQDFHEPFYRDYLRDDLAEAMREVGLEVESSEPAFVAKVVVARKRG